MTETPPCRDGYEHDFFELGTDDNGEKVSRCGNCLTLKFEAKDGTVRYEKAGYRLTPTKL